MIRVSIVLGALFAMAAAAQPRPAWDDVFSTSQADRGRAAYGESCARCHGPDLAGAESSPPLTGVAFLARWTGKGAADLLDRTRRTMPTDNPGGLTNRQYADIVAHVLSVNHFRAGARELGGGTRPAP